MAEPRDARQTAKGRFYTWKGEQYPSVTNVIGILNKPALVPSARKIAVMEVLDNLDSYAAMIESQGYEKTRLYAARQAKKVWDTKTEQGTAVHEAIESMIAGRFLDITPDLEPWMKQLDAWLVDNTPEILHSEITVYNRREKYAGTVDVIMRLEDLGVTLCDVKTGGLWPEVALQLAAYRGAEFIGRDGTEIPMPTIDACAVLHLTPDACDLVSVRNDWQVYRAFLNVRRAWDWVTNLSGSVLP